MVYYRNKNHKNAYLQAVQRGQVDTMDRARRALLYLLTLAKDTRDHLGECYNFKTGGVQQECLKTPWITDSGRRTVQLACSLFAPHNTPPVEIGRILGDPEYYPFYMQAIQICFGELRRRPESPGRPQYYDAVTRQAVRDARQAGKTIRAISNEFDMSTNTVSRILRES